jgi:uncharacterized protein (TIGR02246 family)
MSYQRIAVTAALVIGSMAIATGIASAEQTQAPAPVPKPVLSEEDRVRAVLTAYKNAIERLDATGTQQLFTADSAIFETGGNEGSYANYLSHHLGPELKDFKSFKFSNYTVDVHLLGPDAAHAVETYNYRIETKSGEIAERIGVATSVLKKESGQWKIVMMHNSGRKPRAQ